MTTNGTLTDELLSTFAIHEPAKRNKLFRTYNDQGLGAYDVFETLGAYEKVSQTDYSHFEENWIIENVQARAAVTQPAVGDPITFVLATDNLDANNNFYPQVGYDVMFDDETVGTVTNIDVSTPTAPAVTVEPKRSTTQFPALSIGENIIFFSNTHAENTGQPEGIITTTTEHTFSTKIIKETASTSGSELTNKNWFEMMSDGQKISGYFMKSQIDMDYKMKMQIDGALLFDEPVTNTALGGRRGMYGLYPWIRENGVTDNHGGTVTMQDFDTNTDSLDSNFSPNEHIGLVGIGLLQKFENLFSGATEDNTTANYGSWASNGGVIYANFDKEKSAQDLFIGFKSLTKSERTYHFKKMAQYAHPNLYGSGGFEIKNSGAFCPTKMKKESKTGNYIPYFRFRYKELNGYSRKMEAWFEGGAGNIRKTNGNDNLNRYLRTEMGSEYIAAPQFLLWEN